MPQYIQVALPLPFRDTFTYTADNIDKSRIGCRVSVPFGPRSLVGIVMSCVPECPLDDPGKVKNIEAWLDIHPLLSQELIALCLWASDYYLHPVGEVIFAALPQRYRDGLAPEETLVYVHTTEGKGLPEGALKRAKRQQEIHQFLLRHREIGPDTMKQYNFSSQALKALQTRGLITRTATSPCAKNTTDQVLRQEPKRLNAEQAAAFAEIHYHRYSCSLLDGATGSGKTELYFHVIARVLQSGRQALVLIPEIGLTPQTLSRFHSRFNVPIAELHSNVAAGERARAWNSAQSGEARIVIGTRLASLTPFQDLGVIIIDEEHDRSYKQQDGFKYSARDVSVYRAHQLNIPVILGSATPSLESLHNVNTGKYTKLTLTSRAGEALTPAIQLVDMKGQKLLAGLAPETFDGLRTVIDRGEQALIFINRRGYAPSLICHHCGWSADCYACDSRMTVHRQPRQQLICHYCDRRQNVPKTCPVCQSGELRTVGYGTEQLEHLLSEQLNDVDIVRIDRDSTRNKHSMRDKLSSAHEDKACIFVGTQMLAKGHHLPNLTLVIIVDADQGFLSPDFRGVEQMGQLIIQVAGRAGREHKQGRVIVQSHRPEQPLLRLLLNEGFGTFASELMALRRAASLPPYWHIASFRSESKRMENNLQFLAKVKRALEKHLRRGAQIGILGPHPAAIEKVNDRYRYYMHVKGRERKQLHALLKASLIEIEDLPEAKRTRWSLEVDSVNTL